MYMFDLSIFTESVMECALCRAVISQIDHDLGDPKVDTKIEEVVLGVCKRLLPYKYHMVIYCHFVNFFQKLFH